MNKVTKLCQSKKVSTDGTEWYRCRTRINHWKIHIESLNIPKTYWQLEYKKASISNRQGKNGLFTMFGDSIQSLGNK